MFSSLKNIALHTIFEREESTRIDPERTINAKVLDQSKNWRAAFGSLLVDDSDCVDREFNRLHRVCANWAKP